MAAKTVQERNRELIKRAEATVAAAKSSSASKSSSGSSGSSSGGASSLQKIYGNLYSGNYSAAIAQANRLTSYNDGSGTKKTGVAATPADNPNTDYQSLINQAVKDNDYRLAAQLEQQRNAKINATGSNYGTTNLYSQYLSDGYAGRSGTLLSYNPDSDYQSLINDAVSRGDYTSAAVLEQQRNSKIIGEGLGATQTNLYAAYLGGGRDSGAYSGGGSAGGGSRNYSAAAAASGNYQSSSQLAALQAQLADVNSLYQQALSANNATATAQLEQLRLQLQSQIDALNRNYQDINRQLYIDYMNSRKNLPQLMSAQGITGGMTESSMLGLDTGYQGQLASNERERLTGIRQLESGSANSELELQIAKAQADREAAENLYSRQAAIRAAILEQANLEDQRAYERQRDAEDRQREADELLYTRALQQTQLSQAAEQAEYERQLQRAQLIAQAGGDYSELYSLLGYTPPAAPAATYYGSAPAAAASAEDVQTGYQSAYERLKTTIGNMLTQGNSYSAVSSTIQEALGRDFISSQQAKDLRDYARLVLHS